MNKLNFVIAMVMCTVLVSVNSVKDLVLCSRNPYEDRICAIYHCPESLTHHEHLNESIEETFDTLGCQISIRESDNTAEFLFPTWFQKIQNKTNFREKLDSKYRNKTYCIAFEAAHVLSEPESNSIQEDVSVAKYERAMKICTGKKTSLNMVVRYFQMASTFISPFFIFFPIIIFTITQEIQNVHSWTHFTNGCCIFVLYVSWGLRYIFFRGDSYIGTKRCMYFGAVQHYFHLSVFSWLVVANYDLLKLSQAHPSAKSLDIKRSIMVYIHLSVFAWGLPIVYMGFTGLLSMILIQLGMNTDGELSLYILPEYGRYRCFIGFNAYWLHLVLPCSILLAIALFYITKTVKILRKKNDESMDHALQKINVMRNLACLKVMVLTSACWGCDILRSFTIAYDRSGMLWLRVILDTIVIYQTIPIFIIYSCRPHILNHLESKFPKLKGAVAVSRKIFFVRTKELDPGLVTHLRVHRRKSQANAIEVPENTFQESHL